MIGSVVRVVRVVHVGRWGDGEMGRWGDWSIFLLFYPILFLNPLTPDSVLLTPQRYDN